MYAVRSPLQAKVAEDIEVVGSLLRLFAGSRDLSALSIPICCLKVLASEAVNSAVNQAIQILGARGYMEPSRLPRFHRDARMLTIGEGANDSLLASVGSSLFDAPDDFAAFLTEEMGSLHTADCFKQAVREIKSSFTSCQLESLLRLRHLLGEFGLFATRLAVLSSSSEEEISERFQLETRRILDILNSPVPYDFASVTGLAKSLQALSPVQAKPVVAKSSAAAADGPASLTEGTVDESVRSVVVKEFSRWLEQNGIQRELAADSNLLLLGLDSIQAAQIALTLSDKLDLTVTTEAILFHPTLDEFCSHLSKMRMRQRERS